MKNKKVVPIKPELRLLLEEFLSFDEYQPIFKKFAKVVGYHGNDEKKIKNILFYPGDDGEIRFSISGMEELFLEFQLIKQLSGTEPYKTLLVTYPEAIQYIRIVAQKMYNKEDITQEDLSTIFNTEEYDRRRAEIDSAENTGSEQV